MVAVNGNTLATSVTHGHRFATALRALAHRVAIRRQEALHITQLARQLTRQQSKIDFRRPETLGSEHTQADSAIRSLARLIGRQHGSRLRRYLGRGRTLVGHQERHARGRPACMIPREDLEARVLSGLKDRMMAPLIVEEVMRAYRREVIQVSL